MTDAEFERSTPELTHDDCLVLDDPYFDADTVAIVTGAASGIGRATAVALAANGLTVVDAATEAGDVRFVANIAGMQHIASIPEFPMEKYDLLTDVMLGQARTKEMMAPVEVANLFVFGFSTHAGHRNGGDLLFDGGYTHTYE